MTQREGEGAAPAEQTAVPDAAEQRPRHPIGVVAERTGLTADVIRAWERRYDVVSPTRDEAGRRLYSDDDVARLRLLARAVMAGRSISQVADLAESELTELVRGDQAARWQGGSPSQAGASDAVEQALAWTQVLDGNGLRDVLERAASTMGLAVFLESVVAPLFRRIGDEWQASRLAAVHEHHATAVTLPLVAMHAGRLTATADAPLLAVATPAGERHEVGAMIVVGMAAVAGWRVAYLGPDLPSEDIARGAMALGARAVALSVVLAASPADVAGAVRSLRGALPEETDLLVGGAGAERLARAVDQAGIRWMHGLADLRTYLEER